MTRAEEAAKAYEESLDYYHCMNDWPSIAYRAGYEQAEKDIISIIESRISEILGDAQPAPVLRTELRELNNKIEEK